MLRVQVLAVNPERQHRHRPAQSPTVRAKSDRTATVQQPPQQAPPTPPAPLNWPKVPTAAHPRPDPRHIVELFGGSIYVSSWRGYKGSGGKSWWIWGRGEDFRTILAKAGPRLLVSSMFPLDRCGSRLRPLLAEGDAELPAQIGTTSSLKWLVPTSYEKGKISIEFAILKDGKVAGMKLATGIERRRALDTYPHGRRRRASNPVPPLSPRSIGGPSYLYLRFNFFYNPDSAELE